MKAFEFSLQTLLDSREALEQLGELRMSEAVRKLQESRDSLNHLRRKFETQVAHAEKLNGVSTTGGELSIHSTHIVWLQHRIEQQLRRVVALERNSEKIREHLLSLMREVKSMERLKQKEKTRWTRKKNRKEQAEMDEVAMRKHHSGRVTV